MIDHEHRLIFIHLPKCGGTSIEHALTGTGWHVGALHDQQHLTAEETLDLYGERVFNSYYKFAVVRNTWDLLVSHYLWGCSGLKGSPPGRLRLGREWGHPFDKTRKWFARKPSFREYLSDIQRFNEKLSFSRTGQDLTQQFSALSIDGQLAVDYVARFENIGNEFRHVCELCGIENKSLPHKLKSHRAEHYSKFYDPVLIKMVQSIYAKDIEVFGFDREPLAAGQASCSRVHGGMVGKDRLDRD